MASETKSIRSPRRLTSVTLATASPPPSRRPAQPPHSAARSSARPAPAWPRVRRAASAVASPMPLLAPVIATTLPSIVTGPKLRADARLSCRPWHLSTSTPTWVRASASGGSVRPTPCWASSPAPTSHAVSMRATHRAVGGVQAGSRTRRTHRRTGELSRPCRLRPPLHRRHTGRSARRRRVSDRRVAGVAGAAGSAVSYVKPHGALYNTIVTNREQAAAVAEAVRRSTPACRCWAWRVRRFSTKPSGVGCAR